MGTCLAVNQDKVAIIEKFGKFQDIAHPGFRFLIYPWVVGGYLSTRIQQIIVNVEAKTKDDVFVHVTTAVQFTIAKDDISIYNAFYKLTAPAHQINAYVENVIRHTIPEIEIDQVFTEKTHIARSIFDCLSQEMKAYGYNIIGALVSNIEPNALVRHEMNEINVTRRTNISNQYKVEAEIISQIKLAEGEAEAAYLAGEGIARQRAAITNGFKSSIDDFNANVPAFQYKNLMDLLLITQYCDTMKDLGENKETNIVFMMKKKATQKKI